MAGKKISNEAGIAALQDLPAELATAVRYLLQKIEADHRGGTVELRVPPFGAVQCIEGMNHRRGTPPNVVEMTPEVFLGLCKGEISAKEAMTMPGCSFSGEKADLAFGVFPLLGL
ncbi:MAG: sterol carrier family protein [Aquiluna sp.]|nr:sterol carrier family protein [Aquiluna sp.]